MKSPVMGSPASSEESAEEETERPGRPATPGVLGELPSSSEDESFDEVDEHPGEDDTEKSTAEANISPAGKVPIPVIEVSNDNDEKFKAEGD